MGSNENVAHKKTYTKKDHQETPEGARFPLVGAIEAHSSSGHKPSKLCLYLFTLYDYVVDSR